MFFSFVSPFSSISYSTPEILEVSLLAQDRPVFLMYGRLHGRRLLLNRLTTTLQLPVVCQYIRLGDIIEMVMVNRLSPKLKKRPVAAGLFLIYFTSVVLSPAISMIPIIPTNYLVLHGYRNKQTSRSRINGIRLSTIQKKVNTSICHALRTL